ncbi:hypothetical protein GOBAR_DD18429 [Gossypium barbadense]|nr:hypothetical protein GOBAR_DD18429 [Gossypium barbadense]
MDCHFLFCLKSGNYEANENSGSQFQKLQQHVARVLKGFSQPPEVRCGTYNPEVLTSQKRQWANFQLQHLDHRSFKGPSRLFESMVVVGLPPSCDIQALQRQYVTRQSEGSGKLRSALSCQNNSRVEPYLEPQVLFVYPPEKPLPLKHKDLLSFCFPGGIEVHAVEKTPSMSELNEILLSQIRLLALVVHTQYDLTLAPAFSSITISMSETHVIFEILCYLGDYC